MPGPPLTLQACSLEEVLGPSTVSLTLEEEWNGAVTVEIVWQGLNRLNRVTIGQQFRSCVYAPKNQKHKSTTKTWTQMFVQH